MNKKLRIFKLITGETIICSIIPFNHESYALHWETTPKNETHEGGIYFVNVEWPAVIKRLDFLSPEDLTFQPYMEGLHKDERSFLIKEEHCVHILTPSDDLGAAYLKWIETQW